MRYVLCIMLLAMSIEQGVFAAPRVPSNPQQDIQDQQKQP